MNMTTQAHTSEQFDHWLNDINNICGRFQAEPAGEPFSGTIKGYYSGSLKFSHVQTQHCRLFRTDADIQEDLNDHYFMVFQLNGCAQIQQADNRSELACGDIYLLDSRLPFELVFTNQSQQISLILPRNISNQNQHNHPLPTAKRLHAQLPMTRLANSLMQELGQNPSLNMLESDAFLDAISSLLTPLQREKFPGNYVQARQFDKLQRLIDAHLTDATLTPACIATEAGLSQRSLYRLFTEHGGVKTYIRNRRLDFCARELRTAIHVEKIAAVGYSFGFVDSSHFCTRFKHRFGLTPAAYRKRYRPD